MQLSCGMSHLAFRVFSAAWRQGWKVSRRAPVSSRESIASSLTKTASEMPFLRGQKGLANAFLGRKAFFEFRLNTDSIGVSASRWEERVPTCLSPCFLSAWKGPDALWSARSRATCASSVPESAPNSLGLSEAVASKFTSARALEEGRLSLRTIWPASPPSGLAHDVGGAPWQGSQRILCTLATTGESAFQSYAERGRSSTGESSEEHVMKTFSESVTRSVALEEKRPVVCESVTCAGDTPEKPHAQGADLRLGDSRVSPAHLTSALWEIGAPWQRAAACLLTACLGFQRAGSRVARAQSVFLPANRATFSTGFFAPGRHPQLPFYQARRSFSSNSRGPRTTSMSFTIDRPSSFSFSFDTPNGSTPTVRTPGVALAETASLSRDQLVALVAEESRPGVLQRRMRFGWLLAPFPESAQEQSRMTEFLLRELRLRCAAQLSTLQAVGALLHEARTAVQNMLHPGESVRTPFPRFLFPFETRAPQQGDAAVALPLEGMLKFAHETLLQQYAILLLESKGEGRDLEAEVPQEPRRQRRALRLRQDFLAVIPSLRNLHARVLAQVVAGVRQQFQETAKVLAQLPAADRASILARYENQIETTIRDFLVRNVSLGVLLCHFDHLHHQLQARGPGSPLYSHRSFSDACDPGTCFRPHLPSVSPPAGPSFPAQDPDTGPSRPPGDARFTHSAAEALRGSGFGGCFEEKTETGGGSLPEIVGVMDRCCRPEAQLRAAIDQAQSLCREIAGDSAGVRVFAVETVGNGKASQDIRETSSSSSFSSSFEIPCVQRALEHHIVFPSPILRYVLAELLKNALKATLDKGEEAGGMRGETGCPESEETVDCVVLPVPGGVWIRISDRGVGMSSEKKRGIFNCLNKGDKAMNDAATLFMGGEVGTSCGCSPDTGEKGQKAAPTLERDTLQKRLESVRVSGCGVGLLLCRAYMQYFGGELLLRSSPGKGTDCFLFVPSLEKRSENLPATPVPPLRDEKEENADRGAGEEDFVGTTSRDGGTHSIPEELLDIGDATVRPNPRLHQVYVHWAKGEAGAVTTGFRAQ
ncbi:ATPase/histidine kinase/DNA gyrase B/HSP90 domain-containing protein [Toxoplasma gondii ARI]|uniref:Protein-serine/threonine kinase n=1 Tax=Toxoplasma gondii ARI TaxID=1074872 RepID=A0A139XXC8_TOXGO|nr:ATPase/histidine kinase/DNA gyrase B/HSP90 domain-containing protein [Toxoplasma gondii ARI]